MIFTNSKQRIIYLSILIITIIIISLAIYENFFKINKIPAAINAFVPNGAIIDFNIETEPPSCLFDFLLIC